MNRRDFLNLMMLAGGASAALPAAAILNSRPCKIHPGAPANRKF